MLKVLVKGAVRRVLAPLGLELRRTARPVVSVVMQFRFAESCPATPGFHGIGRMEDTLRFLHRLDFRPQCMLDVGAHAGGWSEMAADVFPGARFVLIEPQAEMAATIERFCAGHPNARLVRAGAGAAPGQAVFTVWDDHAGSSFVPDTDPSALASGKQRVLPIVTIDDVFRDEPHLPDLVKLDVQGYELEALKGAQRLFGHTEVFVLEVSLMAAAQIPTLAEVVAFMGDRGYRVYDIGGFLRRPLDGALAQVDLVFARATGALCRDNRWSAADPLPKAA